MRTIKSSLESGKQDAFQCNSSEFCRQKWRGLTAALALQKKENMKKILVVINDHKLPRPVLDCAVQIAKEQNAHLFGLFVHSPFYGTEKTYPFPSDINLTDNDFTRETDKAESQRLEQAQVHVLANACAAAGVAFQAHGLQADFLDTLIDHSAFADLMICDAANPPVLYSLNSLLADAHCPVLLVPAEYAGYDELIFTYDGSSSSMQAIRQFTYLFAAGRNLPVYLASVLPENIRGIEYSDLLKEWLPLYYPNFTIEILKGNSREEMPQFISRHKKALVVMGAYGRSSLSRLFKESLASVVLQKTSAPLFITHD